MVLHAVTTYLRNNFLLQRGRPSPNWYDIAYDIGTESDLGKDSF